MPSATSRRASARTSIPCQNDGSAEKAAAYLEIPVEHLEAAARYYGEYTDEVDELFERSRAAGERERERWRRGHDALA